MQRGTCVEQGCYMEMVHVSFFMFKIFLNAFAVSLQIQNKTVTDSPPSIPPSSSLPSPQKSWKTEEKSSQQQHYHWHCRKKSAPLPLQEEICTATIAGRNLHHYHCRKKSAPLPLQEEICTATIAGRNLHHYHCRKKSAPLPLQEEICTATTAGRNLHRTTAGRNLHRYHCRKKSAQVCKQVSRKGHRKPSSLTGGRRCLRYADEQATNTKPQKITGTAWMLQHLKGRSSQFQKHHRTGPTNKMEWKIRT